MEAESKTLWIGDLEAWMDEPFLQSTIDALGYSKDLVNIKLIKDKATGLPSKYGFIEFTTRDIATNFYQNYNNRQINNTNKSFKLNWAAYGGSSKPTGSNFAKSSLQQISIYVGDLDPSVTEHKLLEYFKNKYPSAYMGKIITDNSTKLSKGYGFVKFSSQEDAQKAIAETNGQTVFGKVIKVSNAYLKTKEESNTAADTNEEADNQQIQRQMLFSQYYSMVNDPNLKIEYEKQIQKTFGVDQSGKKLTLKQSLETVGSLSYAQTKKSEEFLDSLPKIITFKAKKSIESHVYS